jgi:hypothetical protein
VWDAGGEALTPVLRLSRPVCRVFFHPDADRLVGVCEGGTGAAWDLSPDSRPIGELVALAQVLSCGHIDGMQERKALDWNRLRSAWQGLAVRPTR